MSHAVRLKVHFWIAEKHCSRSVCFPHNNPLFSPLTVLKQPIIQPVSYSRAEVGAHRFETDLQQLHKWIVASVSLVLVAVSLVAFPKSPQTSFVPHHLCLLYVLTWCPSKLPLSLKGVSFPFGSAGNGFCQSIYKRRPTQPPSHTARSPQHPAMPCDGIYPDRKSVV